MFLSLKLRFSPGGNSISPDVIAMPHEWNTGWEFHVIFINLVMKIGRYRSIASGDAAAAGRSPKSVRGTGIPFIKK